MSLPPHRSSWPPLPAAPIAVDVPGALPDPWERETEVLLDRLGLLPGTVCLDLGRGATGVLGPLSRRVGPTGRVTALVAGAPLADVRRGVRRAGLPNVDVVGTAALARLPRSAFDLVHARFLLPQDGRDGELLRLMVGHVQPGGIVAVQEPDATCWPCYPPLPAWDRLTSVVGAALARGGADLTAGQRTFRLFRQAGLEAVGVRAVVTALYDGHPAMRLPILLAEALRDRIVGAGLLAEVELEAALRECERRVLEPATFVTTFLATQVWGRKPPA